MENQKCYTGVSHGTLGELFQGPVMVDGSLEIGIISLPIRKFSWVHYTIDARIEESPRPSTKSKTFKAVDLYLAHYGCVLPKGGWTFNTELAQGKGMSSSTADIVAVIRCLDAIFGRSTPAGLVAQFLRQIERSDSVFLDHYALYLSREQQVVQHFSCSPQLYACFIDEGDVVDTEESHGMLMAHYESNLDAYLENLGRTVQAFKWASLKEICEGSTESARLSQGVIPKKTFEILEANQARHKADGLVVAHTGSIIGYLFTTKPSFAEIGALSSFFFNLGYQCNFVKVGL